MKQRWSSISHARVIFHSVARWSLMTWVLMGFCVLWGIGNPDTTAAASQVGKSDKGEQTVLHMNLDDAIVMFLKKNLDLLIVKYGIGRAKAQTITAGLFPNPSLSINTLSAYTQGCTMSRCGSVMTVLSQLFEVAGKRGFRIESAGYGTQSAEANFEDTLRQLRYAVKDTYYRIQVGKEHLAVDRKTLDRLNKIYEEKFLSARKTMDQRDLVRLRIQRVLGEAQVIHDVQDVDAASADLRTFLGLEPLTEFELTTELAFRRIDPDMKKLRRVAEGRPDIRAKRLLFSKRKAELSLALSIQYPDVTVDLGYMVQGPRGPDNQQQWTLNFGVPLPIFDRNQGGIGEASAWVQAAGADLQKSLIDLQNQVDMAYRRFIQSRRLVETYHKGVLEDVQDLFSTVEQAYESGNATIFDFLDSARTASDIHEEYLEALFSYQRDLIGLESAVGQDLS